MSRLEVIRVRSSATNCAEMLEALGPVLEEARRQEGMAGCQVYVHEQIQGDLAVHVLWSGESGATVVGRVIAGCLQRFGLVDHAMWKQVL